MRTTAAVFHPFVAVVVICDPLICLWYLQAGDHFCHRGRVFRIKGKSHFELYMSERISVESKHRLFNELTNQKETKSVVNYTSLDAIDGSH